MTLRFRLVVTVLALLVAGMAGSSFATFGLVRHHLTERLDDQLTAIGERVETALNGGAEPAPRVLADAMTGMGFAQPAFIEVRTAAASMRLGGGPSVPASLRPGNLYTLRPDDQHPAWRVRVSTFDGGTVYVGTQRTQLDGLIRELAVAETVFTLIGLAIAALVAVTVVRRAMRPLDGIATAAHAIRGGDLRRRVPPGDPRTEVGQVGEALNTMLGRIEVAFRQRAESEERLRRFVADAAHELRTPVTTIRGYAELFRRGAAERPDDLAKAMHRIEGEAARMGVLVDELVLLARLDENRPPDVAPLDLCALAADAVADARAVEPEREVRLVGAEPVMVSGDGVRLRQVLANLLANVRHHTPAGTPATVTVRADGDEAVVEVADEGPGMAEEDADHAFERFYRRSRGGGSGLGLAIVDAIMQAHGGAATLSASPGAGTTVTVRMPRRAR
jgi:two-component system OmpR family sensor kinase